MTLRSHHNIPLASRRSSSSKRERDSEWEEKNAEEELSSQSRRKERRRNASDQEDENLEEEDDDQKQDEQKGGRSDRRAQEKDAQHADTDDEQDIEIVSSPHHMQSQGGLQRDQEEAGAEADEDSAVPPTPPLSPSLASFLADVTSLTESRSYAPLSPQAMKTRLVIRKKYAELINHTRTDQNIIDNDEGLSRGMILLNQLNKVSCHISEELQDAEEMTLLATKGHEKAKRHLDHALSVSIDDYLKFLQRQYATRDGEIDWIKLGDACAPYQQVFHVTSFMTGVYDYQHEHKQRQTRSVRQRDELKSAAATEKTNTANNIDLDMTQTTRRCEHLRQLLLGYSNNTSTETNGVGITSIETGLMLWEFLLDPDSFVRTVENLFDFSFLMKEEIELTYQPWDLHRAFPYITYKPPKHTKLPTATTVVVVDGETKTEVKEIVIDAEEEKEEDNKPLSQRRSISSLPRVFAATESKSAVATATTVSESNEGTMMQCVPAIDYPRWRGLVKALGITKAMISHQSRNKQRHTHGTVKRTQQPQQKKKHTQTQQRTRKRSVQQHQSQSSEQEEEKEEEDEEAQVEEDDQASQHVSQSDEGLQETKEEDDDHASQEETAAKDDASALHSAILDLEEESD